MTCKSRVLLLFALAVSACIAVEPGTSIEVEVAAISGSATDRAGLVSDAGYHVQLEQMYFVLSRVELVPCPGAQRISVLRELFGPSVAHAHGVNTMTAWAVPNVIAPLVDSAPVSIAALHPPAIAYCSLRIALEAADADAERMPSEVDMNGLSMFVTGSYGFGESAPGIGFLYESFAASRMDLPIVDSAGHPAPITLSADNLHARLRVEIAYQQLFNGLTLYPGSFSTFGDIVLGQALTHARVVVQ
jgi:hypothetical protein